MEPIKCHQCQKEFEGDLQVCPHCGAPYGAQGVNYPRLPGWIATAMVVFFVSLILLFVYSMFFM